MLKSLRFQILHDEQLFLTFWEKKTKEHWCRIPMCCQRHLVVVLWNVILRNYFDSIERTFCQPNYWNYSNKMCQTKRFIYKPIFNYLALINYKKLKKSKQVIKTSILNVIDSVTMLPRHGNIFSSKKMQHNVVNE